ncbi:serine/threonine-protein phosphatase 7 long form-like protein [Senna tora]|uniref:Serine/threonine-protein phosphatase 7 long form-like protein n=1 Tax=Senna tora TaxID=362788 RepID=A0A834TJ68_9FABA|nr:serine/threonine-protein phosphatase 7 long form-like protein [Senna tora]
MVLSVFGLFEVCWFLIPQSSRACLVLPDRVLRPRRHRALELLNLPVQIVPLHEQTGFYGVARVGYIPFDHALISTLVERWRPETNSFHMPIGECNITLQDVAI